MAVNIMHARSQVFVGPTRALNSFGFAYVTLLEERKPGLDEKTIIKLILCLQKWSTRSASSNFHTEFEINPLESDFYHPTPLPSGISWASDLPPPSKFPISLHGGVWIFSGSTQYILKIREHRTVYTVGWGWIPQGFLFSTVFGLVYLLNWLTVWQNFSKNSWK